jgi:hypothetical protein
VTDRQVDGHLCTRTVEYKSVMSMLKNFLFIDANKNKCSVFRPVEKLINEVLPQFVISGKPVECVKRRPHLGT